MNKYNAYATITLTKICTQLTNGGNFFGNWKKRLIEVRFQVTCSTYTQEIY